MTSRGMRLYGQRRADGWCSQCARRKHRLCTGVRTVQVGRSTTETAMPCDCPRCGPPVKRKGIA